MANTLTTLTHTVLAQRILEAFVQITAPIRAFATDFSPEAVQRGDKVKVPYVSGGYTANDFNGTYLVQDSTAEGLDITIDKRKYVSWGLTTENLATMPQLSMDMFVRQKANALAVAFLQDVWSVITNANYGAAAKTSTAANFDADDVVDLREAAVAANWPANMRSLVLDESYVAYLLKDNAIQDASASGSSDPLIEGSVRRLCGFDLYESTLVPANGENLTGFICLPDAIYVANRALVPDDASQRAGLLTEVVTDPSGSGMTMVMRDWFDNDTDTHKKVLEVNYGYRAGGNTGALKRIVSS